MQSGKRQQTDSAVNHSFGVLAYSLDFFLLLLSYIYSDLPPIPIHLTILALVYIFAHNCHALYRKVRATELTGMSSRSSPAKV